ncbi:MAG: hypothetical protein Q4F74_07930, partial [Synergistaceae bacterium]|nr:hypothetical protein [Synergistaceae bacterium]
MNGADGRQRAKTDKLRKIKWILPDKKVINIFNNHIKTMFNTINCITRNNHRLMAQRDLLL